MTDPSGPDEHDEPDRSDRRPSGRAAGRRKRRPRSRFRRVLRVLTICAALVFLVLAGTAVVLYNSVEVPKPDSVATAQAATVTYADGTSVLARIGSQNRTSVPLSKVPPRVRNAVLAAEDRHFYSEGGISLTGTLRAAWNDVRGGALQGGSTITQQYVKNAFLTQKRTLTRKVKEAIIATKLARKYSKNQVLEWYLNTIYFGRGAYGIEAAAQTYFGTDVSSISTAQAAVLASSIRAPALYDPQDHLAQAKARWHFVINGMVTMGVLPAGVARTLTYPTVRPISASNLNKLGGPQGHIVQQVKEELAAHGFDEAALGKGVKVVTTIDPKAQAAAQSAVQQTFAGQPKDLRNALVAVDPKNGQILAYYGGSDGYGFDYAQAWRQPGSSFKPYVLATALSQTEAGKQDITDYTDYNGTSPQVFGGVTVHNSDGEGCSYCSVVTAMTMSLNTVFYRMGLQVGPAQVAATAHAAGVARDNGDTPTLQNAQGQTEAGIAIGQYEVRPVDQAAGYATIADGGVAHQPYLVKEVLDSSGHVLYRHKGSSHRAFSSAVANDVTYSMEQVAAASGDALADGRPTASKTGTAQLGATADNKDAWMVGFTPQVVASVWTGTNGSKPIKDSDGNIVYGSGLPGHTWKAFMDAYLSGTQAEPLTTTTEVGSAPPTAPPTTSAPPATTAPPTTSAPTTAPPTTSAPPATTAPPTTSAPTTTPPTTSAPTTAPPTRTRSTRSPVLPILPSGGSTASPGTAPTRPSG